MRRLLALAMAGGAVLAMAGVLVPAPVTVLLHGSRTIYPRWTLVLVVVVVVASVVALARPAASGPLLVAGGVCAAQLAGIGAWAHEHWVPAWGMGGGYVGGPGSAQELAQVAWVVVAGGSVASVAAVALLVVDRQWPVRVPPAVRGRRVVTGVATIGLVPLALAAGDLDAWDATTMGAFALIYSVPWGASLVASAWLGDRAALAVPVVAAVGAVLSAALLTLELFHGEGRVALLACAVLFGALAAVEAGRSVLRTPAGVSSP